MSELLTHFIKNKKINSYQKVRLLLFLYHHPCIKPTIPELAQKLYLGEIHILMNIMTELEVVGLIDCKENRYALGNDPAITAMLQRLSKTVDDPIARQRILQQISYESQSRRISVRNLGFILPEGFIDTF
jgi:hypothetical protein